MTEAKEEILKFIQENPGTQTSEIFVHFSEKYDVETMVAALDALVADDKVNHRDPE